MLRCWRGDPNSDLPTLQSAVQKRGHNFGRPTTTADENETIDAFSPIGEEKRAGELIGMVEDG